MARPTKYDPKFCKKVDDYLKKRVDEDVKVVRQVNTEKGYEMYDNKVKVQLPTIEGFARFINVSRSTVFKWRDEHPQFSDSLEKILIEQKERVLNKGLSGDYNSTIAKLILSSNHNMVERKDVTSEGKKLPTPILEYVSQD